MTSRRRPSAVVCTQSRVHLDAAEVRPAEVAQTLVVVAGHEHQPRTAAHLVEQRLHHVAVGLRPNRAALDAPEVDDVADQIDRVGVVVLEEIQQGVRHGIRGSRDARRTETGSDCGAPCAAFPNG